MSLQWAAMLSKTPKPSQNFPKHPNKAAIYPEARVCGKRRHLPPTHTIAAVGGIRYAVVGRTPRCRAIELGRFGRVWEGLGSGQSPLQPVDAPLRQAIRRVMPAAHTMSLQWAAMLSKTLKPSQNLPSPLKKKPPSTASPGLTRSQAAYSSAEGCGGQGVL